MRTLHFKNEKDKKEVYRGEVQKVSAEEMEEHFKRLQIKAERSNWSKTHKPYCF